MTEEMEMPPEVPALETEPEKHKKGMNISMAVGLLGLLIAVAAIVMVFTQGSGKTTKHMPEMSSGSIAIGWINTDTIWAKYGFVEDMKAELSQFEKKLQDQYTSTVSTFQKEYEDYIKKGTSNQLSLDEQKRTEEKLAKKQQNIQELDAQLSQQLLDEKTARNMEVHDSIVNFIARLNKDHKFTFIMERSYGGGLLWADPAFEITDEVIAGLNKEYEPVRKLRESNKK